MAALSRTAHSAPPDEPPGPRIIWLMPQLDVVPAASGNAGPTQRRGLAQTMADYLVSHWGGQTRHDVVMANIKRGWREMQSGEPACMLGMLHTPDRDPQAWFADTHLTPPPQFVVRSAVAGQVPRNAAGEVDLSRVWAEKRLRGAIVQGRSYGPGLDEMILRLPPDTMSAYVTSDFGGNLLSMLAIGRVDYTLEYDFILAEHLLMRGGGAQVVTFPIQGYAEPVVSGVACPRNDWGRRVAAHVDRLLSTPQARQALKEELLSHLSPEARARYGARIEAFYNRPPAQIPSAPPPPPGRPPQPPQTPR